MSKTIARLGMIVALVSITLFAQNTDEKGWTGYTSLQGSIEADTSVMKWDSSVGYNFNQHLRFQFEAINLTDEYTRTHMRNENQMGAVTQLGRRIMIGARYKF